MSKVDTNLEAYKLVRDPTHLLYLLFTKYGDIEEDFNNLIVNQLLYNKLSHLNSLFKENFFINNRREFFKRIYKKKESKDRIPKLFDYYRNYYDYFCKPFFLNFFSANLLHNYYNNKAEIFYKNNYSSSIEKNEEDNNNNNNDNDNERSESLSSLDNDTENKTIFTKRNKYIIDNNIDSNKCSITLTFDSFVKDNKELISKRSTNDSFKKGIEYFIHEYKAIENKKRNNKLLKTEDNKIINSNEINENLFKIRINDLKNKNSDLKEIGILNKNIKDKSYNLISDDIKNIEDVLQRINHNKKIASKLSRNSSNLEEFKKYTNNANKLKNNIHDIVKNKFWTNNKKIIKNNNNESKNNKNIISDKEKNFSRNSSNQNLFKLSSKLHNKKSINNFINYESRNSPKKVNDLLKLNDLITLKSSQNNQLNNKIKIFKLSNNQITNNLFSQAKIKALSMNKNSTESIKNCNYNNQEVKIEQSKLNTIIQSHRKNKSNRKLNILNKFSPMSRYSTNINVNNNKLINYNSETNSPKSNVFLRNEICSKKKSVTTEKFSPLDSMNLEKNNQNKKKVIQTHKNNLSYSNHENSQNNILNNIKFFNSDHNRDKRNTNLIPKNFLYKNYTMGKVLMGNNNSRSNNKKVIYGINNLKNILHISRNKSKKTINSTLSHSKSTTKVIENKNLIRVSSFKTISIDNKRLYINNLKKQNNNYKNNIIQDIIKNSKNDNYDIKSFGNNKNKCKSFGKEIMNGLFSPINIKQSFNFNKGIFKAKKKF